MRWFVLMAFVAGCWTNSTTPPAQPVEHHESHASRPRPAPPPPASEYEVLLEEFDALADRMCSCSDSACATLVSEDLTKWAQELASRDELQMGPSDQQRATDISTRLSDCMMRVMAPPALPSSP